MCQLLAVAREAGLGPLSLYFAIHGKGTVTLTLELVLYFRKLKVRKSPAPTGLGLEDPTSLAAGKAEAQR